MTQDPTQPQNPNTPATPSGTGQYEFKAEMKQLLHLIIHSLYTHPEIFLRELVSNASDALNKVRFRQVTGETVAQPDLPFRVSITADKEAHTVTIEDTGIGMTKDELIERIGTVASSGTLDFLSRMKEQNAAVDGNLIGQFGVGFYSVFMVAEEAIIETRSALPDQESWIWTSTGEGRYSIEPGTRTDRGTRITLKLREDAREFQDDWRIKSIIRKYSNFVDFPIFVGDEQVNKVSALWHRKKEEMTEEELREFYKFISNDWEDPLGHLTLSIEGRVNFKALVFFPKSAPPRMLDLRDQKSLHLYSNKVFIQDDCKELLPEYLRFVRGVVDTEDLPLNVSRELTQNSPVMAKMQEVLTSRILSHLEDWAKNDAEKFSTFTRQFGSLLKLGLNSDFANRDKLIALTRFETTKTGAGETCGFSDLIARMKEDQKDLYFVSGEGRALVERNPNLEYFTAHDLEVILLTDPVDAFTIGQLGEVEGKKLVSIERADLELQDTNFEGVTPENIAALVREFTRLAGDRVESVLPSKRLVSSPAVLVTGKEGLDPQMERIMKLMNQDFQGSKRLLEIHPGHPLLQNLAALIQSGEKPRLVEQCISQVIDGAFLLDGREDLIATAVGRMTEIMVESTGRVKSKE